MRKYFQATILLAALVLTACGRQEAADTVNQTQPAVASQVVAVPEQTVFVLSYRVGPYGAAGTSLFAGWIDYMSLVNAKGGVNGVKLAWQECETEYNNSRGMDCYERLKQRFPGQGTMLHPVSTGISYALMEKARADRLPLVMLGYGRTEAKIGAYFPYAFPLVATYQTQASAMLAFLAQRSEGGLAGKRIAFVFHDSAYGREPMEVLHAEAKQRRFDLLKIPVAHPGLEQADTWRQLVAAQPDWVILWGWGGMNTAALQAAQKYGYPAERILGNWWSGAEEDVVPAGAGAKGYMSASFGAVGADIPVMKELRTVLYGAGRGELKEVGRLGSVLYSRGVLHGIVTVEAIRTAQARFGRRPLSGEEVRWGLENLRIDQARLRELGAEGMMPDLHVTCEDHEGSGRVLFQQWDGGTWRKLADAVEGDRRLVTSLLSAAAERYATENRIVARDCASEARAMDAAQGGQR